jgi:hypothetical protein
MNVRADHMYKQIGLATCCRSIACRQPAPPSVRTGSQNASPALKLYQYSRSEQHALQVERYLCKLQIERYQVVRHEQHVESPADTCAAAVRAQSCELQIMRNMQQVA